MLSRMISLVVASLLFAEFSYAEKACVVERDRGSLAVIEDQKLKSEIPDLGDLSHATVKFDGGYGYVIGRDGYISRFDPASDKVLGKAKVGNSGIGLTFVNGYIAVANYDPKNVVILDRDLNIVKRIETDSRNVGIKSHGSLLIFSLMDRDEIWVLDQEKGFEPIKIVKDAGKMPFDALLSENVYVTGFFNEAAVGLLDLKTMEYTKRDFNLDQGEGVLKIPHFGMWGVWKDKAFIPSVGQRKLQVIDLGKFEHLGDVELVGLPVFAVVSPDKRYIAVNYSGDKEDILTIVDPENAKVLKDITAGKRIMHMRFSGDGKKLYVSSYFENMLKAIDVAKWEVGGQVQVPSPSGIFLPPQ